MSKKSIASSCVQQNGIVVFTAENLESYIILLSEIQIKNIPHKKLNS